MTRKKIKELENRIAELEHENNELKDKLKTERMTFAIAVPKMYYANTLVDIANLKNEAIAQLAYKIGTSGYFRERENGNFIQLEVTLLK